VSVCRSVSRAPSKFPEGRKPTAQVDIVIVVWLIDGLYLAADIELLDFGVEILDRRVLLVAAKDQLRLSRPVAGVMEPRQQDPLHASPPGQGWEGALDASSRQGMHPCQTQID